MESDLDSGRSGMIASLRALRPVAAAVAVCAALACSPSGGEGTAEQPAEMAPEFIDGFFVVPRLEAMDDS